MFKPASIKLYAIIAIIFSALGMILTLVAAFKFSGIYILNILSWGLLVWASILAFQLSSYKLYEEEFKKVGIRTWLIYLACLTGLFLGGIIEIIFATLILGTLWGLKRNYDDWDNDEPVYPDPPSSNQ